MQGGVCFDPKPPPNRIKMPQQKPNIYLTFENIKFK